MAFDMAVEVPSEVAMYNAKWQALLDHVRSGIPLHEQVRDAIKDLQEGRCDTTSFVPFHRPQGFPFFLSALALLR
jgi:hypothetical protein